MNVHLERVCKKFGNVVAANEITVSIKDGHLTSLLGPSGCGKTTLLNLIAGIESVTSGTIKYEDRSMNGVPPSERNIGYVFQNYSLYPTMSVYENLRFPLDNQKEPRRKRKAIRQEQEESIAEIAELLHISDLLGRKPHELSGGQQQRVAIGRALIKRPDIILMDEPFANLDTNLAEELRDEIRLIQKKTRTTTLFVTHNQADARAISDEIIVLNEGSIQQVGTVQEIYSAPQNLFVASFFTPLKLNVLTVEEYYRLFGHDKDLLNTGATKVAFRPESVVNSDSGVPFEATDIFSNGIFDETTFTKNGISIHCVGISTPIGNTVRIGIPKNKLLLFRNDERI